MYFLYVLRSLNYKRTYIGITGDVTKRVREHNGGLARSTRFYRPYVLVHTETFTNKSDARKREILLKKNWHEKEKLLKLVGIA